MNSGKHYVESPTTFPPISSIENWKHTKFNITKYHKMFEQAILDPEKHYELLQGIIYEVMPFGPKHVYLVKAIAERLHNCLQGAAEVYTQSPVQFPPESEPEPDIVILKPPAQQYFDRLPTFKDVLLWIEVSDTTLHIDRNTKLPLCAQVNIPEFWLVDVSQVRLEVHRQPDSALACYRQISVFSESESVAPEAFPECKLHWWK